MAEQLRATMPLAEDLGSDKCPLIRDLTPYFDLQRYQVGL